MTALELNCGTGEDAVWLARQGWQVLATDVSPEMVAAARQKAINAGVEDLVRAEVCAMENIGRINPTPDPSPNGRGDATSNVAFGAMSPLPLGEGSGVGLILSDFGGLNCMPSESLKKLSLDLQGLISKNGCFIAVVMSRFCWWEIFYFLLKGQPRNAFRRFGKKPLTAPLDANTAVQTWYYSPAEFRRHFPGWQATGIRPVGFWLPPSYLNPFFEKHPRFLRALNYLETHFTPAWLSPMADHFFICLKIV
ncbi:MAG: class I SAM-dependent methyltransferase [Saprospiraceae bacterium]|nr:class I SAM-dependent methyltransferase [Saprospiraceae bacterium]